MPGILPMKVIKVGTSAQARIAQACDRCRSKKIRCDGFRPTCTQCSNVGFECKTSDKLSRRAFPRGYTESLEERVRTLEGEVREFKDLLDEKDETIEMLSKMHAQAPQGTSSSRRRSSTASSYDRRQLSRTLQHDKDSLFKLQQPPYLMQGENKDLYFMGNSSSRAFVAALGRRLQECGLASAEFNVDALFPTPTRPSTPTTLPLDENAFFAPPSRLHSDQMVNIFFQEWAPLFPVLHRPTFLTLYEQYVSNSASVQDRRSLAQLNLVFGIAALSNERRIAHSAELCERQWTTALASFVQEPSLVTLQCLVLAQIYYLQKGNPDKVLHYKGLAIAIAHRLGLHLSQKPFSLGVLTLETRKKVFWSLYTVDCFSAALLGLPKGFREEDICCEYPADADDEYITENGFQPTLPGEYTKLSSALALFRGCRIMAKVLEQNYPCTASHELSLQDIAALNEELEAWSSALPSHLKLEFVQDKPSTSTISSRSPLLSLTYNFIRTIIHRPAICANLGDRASSSAVVLASANKQIIQITQLLDERNLSFSHCMNKSEMLLCSGIGLLFQALDLDRESKLMKDTQRLLCCVVKMLDARGASCSAAFKQLVCTTLSISLPPAQSPMGSATISKRSSITRSSPPNGPTARHNQLTALAARYTLFSMNQPKLNTAKQNLKSESSAAPPPMDKIGPRTKEKSLRPLAPSTAVKASPTQSEVSIASTLANEVTTTSPQKSRIKRAKATMLTSNSTPNLDYFSFSDGDEPSATIRRNPTSKADATNPSIWENLLHTLDASNPAAARTYTHHHNSSSDSIYDWPSTSSLLTPCLSHETSVPPSTARFGSDSEAAWSPDMWDFTSTGDETQAPTKSVLGSSDEGLTSGGEEFSLVDMESVRSGGSLKTPVAQQTAPEGFSPEDLELGDLDLEAFTSVEEDPIGLTV